MAHGKTEGGQPAELQSFGRRKGRKLSVRQQGLLDNVLPAVALDLSRPAPPSTRDIWLEIGFGGGEHLIAQAQANRGIGFIGCEPFIDGVVKVLAAIDDRGLRNIALHADDARDLLRWLPPASLGRVFMLFPDPWPKKKHRKRRLLTKPTLDLLARAMQPGAELRSATDIADYARTMLLAVQAHESFDWPARGPDDWRIRPDDWPRTRYEEKAKREGRRCYYFRFRRDGKITKLKDADAG